MNTNDFLVMLVDIIMVSPVKQIAVCFLFLFVPVNIASNQIKYYSCTVRTYNAVALYVLPLDPCPIACLPLNLPFQSLPVLRATRPSLSALCPLFIAPCHCDMCEGLLLIWLRRPAFFGGKEEGSQLPPRHSSAIE